MLSAARNLLLLFLAALQHVPSGDQAVLTAVPRTPIQLDDRQFKDGRSRFLFTIPGADAYQGVVWRSTEPQRGVRVRSGLLETVPGAFVVTETNGSIRARLHAGDKVYRIRQEPGQPALIEDISDVGPRACDTTPRQGEARLSAESPLSAAVPVQCAMGANDPCKAADAAMTAATATANPRAACKRTPSGERVVIDVMVIYTADVRDTYSTEEIWQNVDESIEETNLAFDVSDIPAELRLARRKASFLIPPADCLFGMDYQESGSLSKDLSVLLTRGDGDLDVVPKLRTQCQADVVLMFVKESNGSGKACVMKLLTRAFSNYAMGIVNFGSSMSHYTFTHELGHLMGAGHEPTDDCLKPGMCDDSKGMKFFANGIEFKSMMAYGTPATTKSLAFSGPDVTWEGVATGTAGDRHNARTLRISAKTVAAFR